MKHMFSMEAIEKTEAEQEALGGEEAVESVADLSDGMPGPEPMPEAGEALQPPEDMDIPEPSFPEGFAVESRSRASVERDIHEARCKVDFNRRRYEGLLSDDPTQRMAIGGYQRAWKSWERRLGYLMDELRKCDH